MKIGCDFFQFGKYEESNNYYAIPEEVYKFGSDEIEEIDADVEEVREIVGAYRELFANEENVTIIELERTEL